MKTILPLNIKSPASRKQFTAGRVICPVKHPGLYFSILNASALHRSIHNPHSEQCSPLSSICFVAGLNLSASHSVHFWQQVHFVWSIISISLSLHQGSFRCTVRTQHNYQGFQRVHHRSAHQYQTRPGDIL